MMVSALALRHSASSARTDAIGSARFESDNAAAARGEFERVVGGLFEDPAVKTGADPTLNLGASR